MGVRVGRDKIPRGDVKLLAVRGDAIWDRRGDGGKGV